MPHHSHPSTRRHSPHLALPPHPSYPPPPTPEPRPLSLPHHHPDIVFVGDIHRHWHHVEAGLQAQPRTPRHVILLGDMECTAPLDHHVAPILAAGATLHWIFGNHDADGGPAMWANLTDPRRNPLTAPGALHGRVVELAGLRIAGLGGTFHTRVWNPPHAPRLTSRDQLEADMAAIGPGWSPDATAALARTLATLAIWPEDIDRLSTQRADILVTHEAPSSHRSGARVLDELARAMGATLVVHGHHHTTYRATAPDGLQAQGVAAAWGATLAGTPVWQGDKPRLLPKVEGWHYRE